MTSPAKTSDDLQGKKIGISTMGALTDWLAHRLTQVKGWDPKDLVEITVGSDKAAEASYIMTHQIDAMITGASSGLQLEETQTWALAVSGFQDRRRFPRSCDLRDQYGYERSSAAVRAFLKSWFETIAYERAHRDETIAYAVKAMRRSQAIETKEYDLVTPMFSADGKFQASGLKVLARSFVKLGQLNTEPDLTKYYTEEFYPSRNKESAMPSKLKITLTCGDYEIVRPLKEGRVEADGIDLTMLARPRPRQALAVRSQCRVRCRRVQPLRLLHGA